MLDFAFSMRKATRSLSATAIGGVMPKKKKKSPRKAKKKTTRTVKRTRGKTSAKKKKGPVKKQGRAAEAFSIELAEVDVIVGMEDDSADDSESPVMDPLDEHFPPDYGGSE
jgi:hypothetical protein